MHCVAFSVCCAQIHYSLSPFVAVTERGDCDLLPHFPIDQPEGIQLFEIECSTDENVLLQLVSSVEFRFRRNPC